MLSRTQIWPTLGLNTIMRAIFFPNYFCKSILRDSLTARLQIIAFYHQHLKLGILDLYPSVRIEAVNVLRVAFLDHTKHIIQSAF